MSCAFFLCAVRNFNQRLEHDKKKLRCTFPEAPELMRKVSARNLQHHLGRQTGSPSFVLTGLVKACRGITKQDVLAQYSFRDEVAVWSHFWRGANNLSQSPWKMPSCSSTLCQSSHVWMQVVKARPRKALK